MKIRLLILALSTLLFMPASANAPEAAAYAQQLGQNSTLPANVQLRFQVLAARIKNLKKDKDPNDVMRFFSDTRIMFWNRPPNSQAEQAMLNLEAQMVGVAESNNLPIDLHPVGYAPVGVAPAQRLISDQVVTANGLANVLLLTMNLADESLATNRSAELLFLRDNMDRLLQDTSDQAVNSDTVRSVLGARARYLASPAAVGADQRLLDHIVILGELLKGMFPPSKLRQTRGQNIAL